MSGNVTANQLESANNIAACLSHCQTSAPADDAAVLSLVQRKAANVALSEDQIVPIILAAPSSCQSPNLSLVDQLPPTTHLLEEPDAKSTVIVTQRTNRTSLPHKCRLKAESKLASTLQLPMNVPLPLPTRHQDTPPLSASLLQWAPHKPLASRGQFHMPTFPFDVQQIQQHQLKQQQQQQKQQQYLNRQWHQNAANYGHSVLNQPEVVPNGVAAPPLTYAFDVPTADVYIAPGHLHGVPTGSSMPNEASAARCSVDATSSTESAADQIDTCNLCQSAADRTDTSTLCQPAALPKSSARFTSGGSATAQIDASTLPSPPPVPKQGSGNKLSRVPRSTAKVFPPSTLTC